MLPQSVQLSAGLCESGPRDGHDTHHNHLRVSTQKEDISVISKYLEYAEID